MEIKRAITANDVAFCREAILQFRTNLDKDGYVEQVLSMMKEGFELYYIPDEANDRAAAFTGIRIYEMLRTGRMIYIDDLFTLPDYRGKGYAGALLDFVKGLAAKEGIGSVHLDTGFALHPAHRLYLNKGYFFACHHLCQVVSVTE